MARSPFAIGSLCFGFFLVANPAYFISCSSAEEEDFLYDEADMLEVVEQLNETELFDTDLPTELSGYQLDFQLEQSSGASSDVRAELAPAAATWIQSAHACGDRTFVKAAAACESISLLPLEGTVRIKDGEDVVRKVEVRGTMEAYYKLTHAIFDLYSDSAELHLIWSDEGGGSFSGVEVSGDLDLPPLNSGLGGAGGGP